jgi:signal transduction histidine kinase
VSGADFRALFEAMPALCAVLAPDPPRYTIVAATEAYCRAAQRSCDQLVGQALFEALPDMLGARAIEAALRVSLGEVCRTRAGHCMAVQRLAIPDSDGTLEPHYWLPVNVPVLGPDGSVQYILHQVEDVTDRVGNDAFQREMTGHLAAFNARLSLNAEAHEEAQNVLETRVLQRTAELARANEALTAALAERERTESERNELLRKLALAQEEERGRLSRDLHDEVGQHLTALGLGLQALSDVAPPGSEVDRRVAQLSALAATLGRELHALAVRLRPRALDDFGIEAALASYVNDWTRQHGIPVVFHADADMERLPAALESALYRIAQEALTNVARHSGATRASIVLERRDGHLHVVIADDGRGFDARTSVDATRDRGGLGLLGIRERAVMLGGSIRIESAPGAGTALFIRLPIELLDEKESHVLRSGALNG